MSTITISAGEHGDLLDAAENGRRLAALVLEVHKLDTYHASQTPLDKMLELAMTLAGERVEPADFAANMGESGTMKAVAFRNAPATGEPAPDDPRALLSRIEATPRGTVVLENTSTDPVHVHFTPKAEQRR